MAARAMTTTLATAILLTAILLTASTASAQSSSPPSSGTGSSCTSVLVTLSPCLNYITGNESTASASCCAQLGKVVQSDPQCLCVALNADPASLGLSVNRTRALALPDECKVQTPPVSDCKKGAAPATSPAGGETGTTPTTGTKTTPPSTSFENGVGAASRGTAGFVVAAVLALAVAMV